MSNSVGYGGSSSSSTLTIRDWSHPVDPAILSATTIRQVWFAASVEVELTLKSREPLPPDVYDELRDVIAAIEVLVGYLQNPTAGDE